MANAYDFRAALNAVSWQAVGQVGLAHQRQYQRSKPRLLPSSPPPPGPVSDERWLTECCVTAEARTLSHSVPTRVVQCKVYQGHE